MSSASLVSVTCWDQRFSRLPWANRTRREERLVPCRSLALVVLAALLTAPLAAPAGARAATPRAAGAGSLSALDLIALEICYTTVLARYYRPVDPALLLGGARTGIVAYLTGRGVANPAIPLAPAHADRWSAENAIDRDVALAVARYGARVRSADLVASTIAGELATLARSVLGSLPRAGLPSVRRLPRRLRDGRDRRRARRRPGDACGADRRRLPGRPGRRGRAARRRPDRCDRWRRARDRSPRRGPGRSARKAGDRRPARHRA